MWATLSQAIAVAIAGAAIMFLSTKWVENTVMQLKYEAAVQSSVRENQAAIAKLDSALSATNQKVDKLGRPAFAAAVQTELDSINKTDTDLSNRLSSLESLAENDPQKAVGVTILNKDVSDLKAKIDGLQNQLTQRDAELSGRINTLFGGMLSALVAFVFFLLARRKQEK